MTNEPAGPAPQSKIRNLAWQNVIEQQDGTAGPMSPFGVRHRIAQLCLHEAVHREAVPKWRNEGKSTRNCQQVGETVGVGCRVRQGAWKPGGATDESRSRYVVRGEIRRKP